jgi:hypothetical protein
MTFAQGNGDALGPVVILALVTILLIAVGSAVVLLSRRWMRDSDTPDTITPFTLQDLREMRARGDIDDTEYTAMRAMILGRHDPATAADRPPEGGEHPDSPGQPDDDPSDPEADRRDRRDESD